MIYKHTEKADMRDMKTHILTVYDLIMKAWHVDIHNLIHLCGAAENSCNFFTHIYIHIHLYVQTHQNKHWTEWRLQHPQWPCSNFTCETPWTFFLLNVPKWPWHCFNSLSDLHDNVYVKIRKMCTPIQQQLSIEHP